MKPTLRSRYMELTPNGKLLKDRALVIVGLMDKTVSEFKTIDDAIGGEIRLGCPESPQVSVVASAFASFHKTAPLSRLDITSGSTEHLFYLLHNDLLDAALIVEPPSLDRYEYIEIPGEDTWGVLMTKDDPLASLDAISADELQDRDIIISRQSLKNDLPRWSEGKIKEHQVVGFYNLAYNATHLVHKKLGVMLCFDGLVNTETHPELTFRPITPTLSNKIYLVWQKQQTFTPVALRFIEHLRATLK